MAPSSAAMLADTGYSPDELAAFGRALERVRGGQDEDAAAEAEGVETGDFYALLDAEDAAAQAPRNIIPGDGGAPARVPGRTGAGPCALPLQSPRPRRSRA
jgi:hypothetical protein